MIFIHFIWGGTKTQSLQHCISATGVWSKEQPLKGLLFLKVWNFMQFDLLTSTTFSERTLNSFCSKQIFLAPYRNHFKTLFTFVLSHWQETWFLFSPSGVVPKGTNYISESVSRCMIYENKSSKVRPFKKCDPWWVWPIKKYNLFKKNCSVFYIKEKFIAH